MVLYSDDIYYVLGLASIPAWISIYYFFVKKNINTSIAFLVLSAFTNRVVFALLDPFLHNWDEKFHALVSKNLMSYPIKPMLRVDAILPYDIAAWCCNHIWVHKQPLFLWQMALSMKMLGVHEITLRLPSIVMGTFSVFLIFDLARRWTQKSDVAFLAAFLFSFSYFQLELTSGLFSSEHNDIAFAFYLTASIWAFVRYTKSEDIKWVLLIGFFSGAAILNKWLTGLLVYGGWGLYEVALYKKDIILLKIKHIFLSLFVCVATFLPWQLYILYRFPLESAITHKHNALHITEALEGHSGDAWFHLHQMPTMYGKVLLFFIPIGLYYLFWNKNVSRSLSVSLVFMVVTLYTFFSVIVQTKMPAFTFPMYAIVWILISTGIIHVLYFTAPKLFYGGYLCVVGCVFAKALASSRL